MSVCSNVTTYAEGRFSKELDNGPHNICLTLVANNYAESLKRCCSADKSETIGDKFGPDKCLVGMPCGLGADDATLNQHFKDVDACMAREANSTGVSTSFSCVRKGPKTSSAEPSFAARKVAWVLGIAGLIYLGLSH